MSGTPELEPIALSPDHQARVDAGKVQADAAHLAGMEKVLAEAQAGARRLTSEAKMPTDLMDLWGEFCVSCEERWALPAHKATCAHKPICEDCWPNGCEACERELAEDIDRRERAAHLILSASLEIRTSADDLRDTDLKRMDWRVRNDVARNVALTIDALRRIQDVLKSQDQP